MSPLSFDRFCAEILAQTDLLRSCVKGADMRAPVPSCPGWDLGRLLRHVGGTHRRVEEIVRTRAAEAAPGPVLDDVSGCTDGNGGVLDRRLADGAARLVRTLREAGPRASARTAAGSPSAAFWARRTVHETAIHRADAALAAGAGFDLDEELALDALDEWMTLASLPEAVEAAPGRSSLLGPGRTLHFHATGPAPGTTAGSRSSATSRCSTSGWSAPGPGCGSEQGPGAPVRKARATRKSIARPTPSPPRSVHDLTHRPDVSGAHSPPAPASPPSAATTDVSRPGEPTKPRPARCARTSPCWASPC
ncbi:maleylpyruvate isomerase family mycothiol-dependent enzyme [Streptomyces rectiverticillatus]|uniref:maleylpyruvate isomerase N-terminal domain-containing protein n=1 Tax=Streptomyces rectiverticillatus TaxID=173860 RepID=UPI0015C3C4D7|nr:maleylpyruvate isomerase N-terminal domain-containing protein [Streptomyces rectiverticillatus]QLE75216.1 maleylpyruvate isomerase family mycothiol-dependent enzyme [Streptomyces rectiverticillatus]